MPTSEKKYWKTVARSEFPWEQDALDFIHEGFPAVDSYRAWSNFEFIADLGSINEVDLLVACPQGVFLIEIKSNPGTLSGDLRDWTWEFEGRRKTVENPVILANRKCKRLKSLLGRQKAFKKVKMPFIEPLVFVSHAGVVCRLSGNAAHYVRLRDEDDRQGILAAIRRRECPGLRQFDRQVVNRPQIKALAQAMDQAGIRPSQQARRVGDFRLEELIFDSPLGIYQDWAAKHVKVKSTERVARIYMVSHQATKAEREIVSKAALREFRFLESLEHPGIVKADPPTECEYGPVLFLRKSADAVRLDHFLREEGDSLSVDLRLDILRQLGEIISYAHGRKVIHRSLSPQSILVRRSPSGRPLIQVFNWQTGARLAAEDSSTTVTRLSMTLHAGQLIEDSSQVFIAPEALSGNADGGSELDVFSLGALTYLLFAGRAPANTVSELQQKLKESLSDGLDIREALDGPVDALVELVQTTANATASDRISVEDFLAGLDLIEDELTSPEETMVQNPLEARKGDELSGGYLVEKRLGRGSVSVVFLVSFSGAERVLKVARSSEYNQRIRDEFETLKKIQDKVRSRVIVAPFELVEFGDLVGFTMESAGEKTMARHLRDDGPLDLTYLQRFGDDLIRAIRDLDFSEGIAHRDIKPDNMGLRVVGKKQYQLCLFDFSLSNASPEDIRVGTPAYLDPFIAERKVKRWDISSECFSVAMTLHEMATGSLPNWGDGRSDPASVKGEVNILPERFDPDLRDRFTNFFRKALKRDFKERFNTPDEMIKAWADIFVTVDVRKKTNTAHPETDEPAEGDVFELPEHLSVTTQLVLLGLSTRLLNALDRLSLVTVADLLAYPLGQIYKLPNVGNKTRRELGDLVKRLRERLPYVEIDPTKSIEAVSKSEDQASSDEFASVDLIARQVSLIGRGKSRQAEQDILQAFLGWNREETSDPSEWLSQSELASQVEVSRQRVGQVVSEGRERWKKFSSITNLRDAVVEMLRAQGGVVIHRELIADLLVARGSVFDEPKRTQMASVAARAAIETERGLKESRFAEYRSGRHVLVAISPELKNYAVALGKVADDLAAEDPLPSPARVIEALRGVKPPEYPEEVAAPSDQRLCQLAVAASQSAALSSRMEIYPVELTGDRALVLAQNALFGGTLTVEEIQRRVSARLPRARALPNRPKLDKLIEELGLDLKWNAAAADGRGAYETPGAEGFSVHTSESVTSRMMTRSSPIPVVGEVPPEIAEAQAIEEKLKYAAANGAYLAISVPPGLEATARDELARRFKVEECDLDAAFIQSMRSRAKAAGADWRVVLEADAAPIDSPDHKNLQMLVERCLPEISDKLRSPDQTKLVCHPGLLSRYDRMDVLGDLAADVGRSDGIYGLWVLVPASEKNSRPTLNHKAIPLSNPAQHVCLNWAWLGNKHRG